MRVSRLTSNRRAWLLIVIAIFGLYVVVPQLGIFKHTTLKFDDIRWAYVFLALAWTGSTYIFATINYCVLAIKPLRFLRTLLVQLASMFVGRLLPAGIGGIGANYAYLRYSKHRPAQAASVVAANNVLGFIANGLLVLGVSLGFWTSLPALHSPWQVHPMQLWAIVVVAMVIGGFLISRFRTRFISSLTSFWRQIAQYRQRPRSLLLALVSSVCLTLANAIAFYYAAGALSVTISLETALIVSSVGILLGTVTPTPGGLGGVEAGLVVGMVAFGIPSANALAVALLYRLISYWAPLLLGLGAFVVSERRGYLGS